MEPLQSCYQGQKEYSPLKWQTEDFMVWFHDLLSNPNFNKGFDHAPFQEHNKDGKLKPSI